MLDISIIVDALEMTNDMDRYFLDLEMMETVCLSEFDLFATVETATLIDENPDRFIALPTKRQLGEYGMMEDFIAKLPNGEAKRTLGNAIQGKGAFRRFKDGIYRYGIQDTWFSFRKAAYRRIARHWCEENGIEYIQKGKLPQDQEDFERILSDFYDDGDETVKVVKIDVGAQKNTEALAEMKAEVFSEEEDKDINARNISTIALLEAIRILNGMLSREKLDAAIVRIQEKIEDRI